MSLDTRDVRIDSYGGTIVLTYIPTGLVVKYFGRSLNEALAELSAEVKRTECVQEEIKKFGLHFQDSYNS